MFFVCAQRMLYGLPLTHQNMTTWVPKSAYNCNQIKNKTLYTQTQTNANTSVEREERMCWNWMVWLRLSWWREKNQCFIHCTLNTNDYRWWKVVRSIRILREWIVSFALIKDVPVSACVWVFRLCSNQHWQNRFFFFTFSFRSLDLHRMKFSCIFHLLIAINLVNFSWLNWFNYAQRVVK